MRGRRPSEICPVPFAAQSDPQALLHDIGGNRSVVCVDQRVLVDLLGRDGDFEDSTKTLLTRTFTCLVAVNGLMNMKTAPLWIAHSISRSATRRFGAPMTMDTSTCHAGAAGFHLLGTHGLMNTKVAPKAAQLPPFVPLARLAQSIGCGSHGWEQGSD